MQIRQHGIHKPVFISSLIIIIIFSLVTLIKPNIANYYFSSIQNWLVNQLGWLYVLGMAIFLCLCVFILCSRFGDIKLGQDHEKPEYGYASWFAMLFSAGMGIGLMFYGVAEPLLHYILPPNSQPESINAAKNALNITFFHWGLEAWAVYAIVGLTLAYFCYRHKLPLLPRSCLYPILGKKIYGTIGHLVDVLAIVGVMFGLATSLGLGAIQLNSGLNFLFDISINTTVQIIIIIVVTSIATISVASGLDKGIKWLSNVNLFLAILLMTAVLLVSNTTALIQIFVQNIGNYLSSIVDRTFNLYAYENKQVWMNGWTLFYWGWWISWSPFVGMFIAKVSRGRTIREFLVAVLFIPSILTFLWMTVFGNSAINLLIDKADNVNILINAVKYNAPVALFEFFHYLPFSSFFSVVAIILIVTFFVTSADSASMVIDIIATGGAKKSILWQRVFWSLLGGILAISLLSFGGLKALQLASIASAFPFLIILFFMCFCLIKALRRDYLKISSIKEHYTTLHYEQTSLPWEKRLDELLSYPNKKEGVKYLTQVVIPAIKKVVKELQDRDLEASYKIADKRVELVIKKTKVNNFVYSINLREFALPLYVDNENNENNSIENYYRAEVFLSHGSQNYDIMGYTEDQLIADILNQYEKHLYFLHLTVADKDIIE
ncbi:BCCT family transporter [Rickettsiales bacterium LUAb2]